MAIKITSAIFGLLFWFGFLGPFCMSASSDILVWLWPIITVIFSIVGITKLINFFKDKVK